MRFVVVILCSVFMQGVSFNCVFAQATQTESTSVHVVETDLPANASVKIEKMEWRYVQQDDKTVSASITVANFSDKKIKRIKFSVIANDQSGLALESEGFSIKKLEVNDMQETNTSKTYVFEKAFVNEKIAELVLRNAIVEYENGSIDIIKKEELFPMH